MIDTPSYHSSRVFRIWLYTWPVCFVFLYVFMSSILGFHFKLKSCFHHFLKGMSRVEKLPQLLFAWESLSFLHFWRTVLPCKLCLFGSFFLSPPWIHILSPFSYQPRFLLRNLLTALWSFPCIKGYFLLLLPLTFSPWPWFLHNFIVMCPGEDNFWLKF